MFAGARARSRRVKARAALFLAVLVSFVSLGLPLATAAGVTTVTLAEMDGLILVSGKNFPASAEVEVRAQVDGGRGSASVTSSTSGRVLVYFELPTAFAGEVSIVAQSGPETAGASLAVAAPRGAAPAATPRPTASSPPTVPSTVPPTVPSTVAPTTGAAPAPVSNGGLNGQAPYEGAAFYGPNKGAISAAAEWAQSRPADAALMKRMGAVPTSTWFAGTSTAQIAGSVSSTVKAAGGSVPVLVAYNIPGRDCGSFSAGGAGSEADYTTWINGFRQGLGNAKAVVIVEPDALAQMCGDTAPRYRMLNYAMSTLSSAPNASVYLDAGNSGWVSAAEMTGRLQQAGVAKGRGFAVNVSNFYTTQDNIAFGDRISAALGGAHYVVDTSRNGSGSAGSQNWCNPQGRTFGELPTTNTASQFADAYLWIKIVGESDGACNGYPPAGTFATSWALDIAKRTWGA